MSKYTVNRDKVLSTDEKIIVERYLYNTSDSDITAETIAKELDLNLGATKKYLDEKLVSNQDGTYQVSSLHDRRPDAEYIVVGVEAGRHISTKQRYILDCLRDNVEIHTADRCGSLSFIVYYGDQSDSYNVDGRVEKMDWIGTLRNLPEWIVFEHDLIDDFNTNIDERRLQLRDDPLTLEEEVREFIEQYDEPSSTEWVKFGQEDEQRLFLIDAPYDDYEAIDSVTIQWSSCRPLKPMKYEEMTGRMDSVILEYLDGEVDSDTAWRELADLRSEHHEEKDWILDPEDVDI